MKVLVTAYERQRYGVKSAAVTKQWHTESAYFGLEQGEGGVNQTLTDDPPAKLPAPTKEASDGWRWKIALAAYGAVRYHSNEAAFGFREARSRRLSDVNPRWPLLREDMLIRLNIYSKTSNFPSDCAEFRFSQRPQWERPSTKPPITGPKAKVTQQEVTVEQEIMSDQHLKMRFQSEQRRAE
ncbi:hypothetical protein EYF80_010075 [Liparis tanakae]|uniref:Uncharacterized protein n=1 Tax=Liparis tanakae TaxID=230148 RepID=A0A4Z2IPF1_9TELE|nr:hypothetical protein EYF80_010075 [Liparis tanakae]